MIDYLKDKKRNGFSLIELVMVMVILGILCTSFFLPKMIMYLIIIFEDKHDRSESDMDWV